MAIGQLNPTQLSARLASMSDQQLQQYAALHQNDPYVMAIAMDVKNQRDAARRSATAPQATPQDPVIQQLIARMAQLPPAPPAQGVPAPTTTAADSGLMSGVATLPARNLERMADGGITGYPEDSGMLDFAQRSEPVVRVAEGGVPGYKDKGLTDSDDGADTSLGSVPTETEVKEAYKAWQETKGPWYLPSPAANPEERAASARYDRILQAYQSNKKLVPEGAAAVVAAYQDPNRPPRLDVPTPARPAPVAGARISTAPRAGAPTAKPPAAPAAPKGGIAELMGPPQPDDIDRLVSGYKAATPQELIGQAQTIAAPWNKEIEEANKPFREQFAAERERLKKGEDQNIWQSVMQAGLAMMASRSPYFMQAVGESGIRGLQMYQEAQQRDAAARKALMNAEMHMVQAERAERSGNRSAAVQLVKIAEDEKKAGIQLGLQAKELQLNRTTQGAKAEIERGLLAVQERRAATDEARLGLDRLRQDNQLGLLDLRRQALLQSAAKLVEADPLLKELAKFAQTGEPGAVKRFKDRETELYLMHAPELLSGSDAGASTGTGARAAADAVVNKKP